MSEDVDIEIIGQDEAAAKPARQIGLKSLGLGLIIAALFGAGGGAVLSKTLQSPAVDISPLKTTLDALETENKTLKAQLTRLQRDIKALPKPAALDMTSIESRLEALEGAKPQAIDQDLLARLEALNEEGSEVLDLSDITARIAALETRPVLASTTPANITPNQVEAGSVLPFPKAAILSALETSHPSGGWLKRSLKKHISVQSEDNPRYLVELIVENIEEGNNQAALTAFDKLPSDAKAAGQAWRESLGNKFKVISESQ